MHEPLGIMRNHHEQLPGSSCSPVATYGPRRQPISATFLTPMLDEVLLLLAGLIVADRPHMCAHMWHCLRKMTPTSTGLQHGDKCLLCLGVRYRHATPVESVVGFVMNRRHAVTEHSC
jgi:hypothetical protein